MVAAGPGRPRAVRRASKKASELPANDEFSSCTAITFVPATRYVLGSGNSNGTYSTFSMAYVAVAEYGNSLLSTFAVATSVPLIQTLIPSSY